MGARARPAKKSPARTERITPMAVATPNVPQRSLEHTFDIAQASDDTDRIDRLRTITL